MSTLGIEERKFYTPYELEQLLNISRLTLYRWRKNKGLSSVTISKNVIRYLGSDLLKFLDEEKR